MKNIIIKSVLLLFLTGSISSCLDYDDLRENPNDPTTVPPSLIFTDLTPGVTTSFTDSYIRMQYHLWTPTDGTSTVSFRSGFGGGFGYGTIRNINKMIEEAEASNAPIYKILAKFYTARTYVEMTRRMGDVPLTEANQGAEIPRPKYDTSKSVYIQSLNWLDEANKELGDFIDANPGFFLDGDVYFNGDLKQWQKLINSYTLRVLISLHKKADDADVNVKGRFNAIVSDPDTYPILTSLTDNAQLEYRNEDNFKQTYNPDNAVYRPSVNYVKTYIDMLKNYQDPRLFAVADPTQAAIDADPGNEAGVRANFDSYNGADATIAPADNVTGNLNGEFSKPNEEKYWNFVGQPGVLLSYWEQEFTIAEAAHRGWISNDAKTHYDNAITASMEWYGVAGSDITAYLTNANSEYITGAAGLTRILEQKYIAFAENSGTESFFNFRRTGVPDLPFSGFNVGDQDPGYPVRWSYPGSELSDNEENYKAALISQFGVESDDIDFLIWELKD
ncbi:SusD/RagB family nutrient-binding outer membrane lipoprotein [Aureibaculum conchae]|uniref:SusD/RagB family nutrient-binding outer membrane lipoprotein n=1 Tax=Aureibaculum sp. 2308TA14-22 TaxID=3108392 RepID=UPI0033957092